MSKGVVVRSRVRPWTQGPMVRRPRRDKVTIVLPTVDTYRQQMEGAQRLYDRLRLSEPRRPQTQRTLASRGLHVTRSYTFAGSSDAYHTLPASPGRSYEEILNTQDLTQEPQHNGGVDVGMFPVDFSNGYRDLPRQHEAVVSEYHEQSEVLGGAVPLLGSPHPVRPLAFSYPLSSDQAENARHVGRKYGWMSPRANAKQEAEKQKRQNNNITMEVDGSSSGGSSEHDFARKVKGHVTFKDPYRKASSRGSLPRDSMDILQLCEHLKTKGLGEPVLSTQSHTGRDPSALPPGVKARCLPRDPSTREKIKGRARLDCELANLRAEAFCEQQRPRAFRTASADLKNQDLRLLEEEERENLHKDILTGEGEYDDHKFLMEEEDDDSSIVGSPLSREELFLRITAWADDVNKALNRG